MSNARKVFKYPFMNASALTVELGYYHKVVLVGLDPATKRPAIWIEHFPGAKETFPHKFEIYGTGHPITGPAEHVGSIVDGSFVWHVYHTRPR